MTSARHLAMFPLSTVLFPHVDLPLQVFEPRYLALLEDCLRGRGELGIVLISRGSEVGGGDQRVDVGTLGRIVHLQPVPGGRFFVVVRGMHRVRAVEWLEDDPYPQARVEALPPDDWPVGPLPDRAAQQLADAEGAVRRLRSLLSELGQVPPVAHDADFGSEPDEIAWHLCAAAPLNVLDGQELLATDGAAARLELLVRRCDELAADVTALLAGGGGQAL